MITWYAVVTVLQSVVLSVSFNHLPSIVLTPSIKMPEALVVEVVVMAVARSCV